MRVTGKKGDLFDDLGALRLPGDMAVETRVRSRKERKRRETFVQTPWKSIEKMRGVDHTWSVLMYLQHLSWKQGGGPIKLANGMLEMDGISREAKRRALRELERRGLITVERHPRKSPTVRMVDM
jgi:DNA-binding HxlR family transcriptional regulator